MQNKNILKNQHHFQKKSSVGFTLVEALVGVTVFALVMGVAAGLFIHVLQSQRKALAYQEVLDQTSFIMEYMARGIRMAKRQKTASVPVPCIDEGRNYKTNPDNNHIKFIRWDHLAAAGAGAFVCYEFFLEGTTLKVARDAAASTSLTSPKLEVVALRFEIKGDAHPEEIPQEQPRVTIVLEVKGREYGPGRRPRIHLQTTVSQRDLDF